MVFRFTIQNRNSLLRKVVNSSWSTKKFTYDEICYKGEGWWYSARRDFCFGSKIVFILIVSSHNFCNILPKCHLFFLYVFPPLPSSNTKKINVKFEQKILNFIWNSLRTKSRLSAMPCWFITKNLFRDET